MVEEGRLSRWSRLKRRSARLAKPVAPALAHPAAPVPAAEPGVPDVAKVAPPATEPEIAPEDLPDPDTLDKDSDFTAFLGDKVPEAIRRKALSVLWRSDPVLANLDGLNDYDEDYTVAAGLGEAIQTAYRAGKGYLEDGEEEPEAGEADADVTDADSADVEPAAIDAADSGAGSDGDDRVSADAKNTVSAGRKNDPSG